MRKNALLASAAVCLIFGASAAMAQDAPPDPNGYYSQSDHDGYYDQQGHYIRYGDQRPDAGPPPPPPGYYDEQRYEANCERGNNAAGTIFGAIAGGLIGGAASHGNGGAVVGGAVLGGLFGNAVTRDMPCDDHPYAFRVYAQGLDGDIGHRYDWRHGDDYGYFIPQREFYRGGYVCRSFTETTWAGGHNYTRSGTACRQRDGYWHFDD